MQNPKTYCQAVTWMEPDNVHRIYHDTAYGFPLESDNELFGRLILEINQAGLSWTTILKKQDNFRKAYAGFNIQKVAAFNDEDRKKLLNDSGIIRNRLKVDAAIFNAKKILELQKEYGSFKNWLDEHHPKTKKEWVKLFKNTFRFTGGEITGEFLMSTGYLEGAHEKDCPVYDVILRINPQWSKVSKNNAS
ncbi:MAG: DNA-3-methyladenine glycosylase I [bacterium]